MISRAQAIIHWNYFIALEEDIANYSRFLEIAESNYASYAIELGRILFAAASEVDVVARKYCQLVSRDKAAENIGNYKSVIIGRHPEFHAVKVHLPRFGLTLTPWSKWRSDSQPHWWRAYTKVKYERHEHFAEANLKNALNAVAALHVLLLLFYRQEAQEGALTPSPRLFLAGEPFRTETAGHGGAFVYSWAPGAGEGEP